MTMTTTALLTRAHDGVMGDDDPAATRRRYSAKHMLFPGDPGKSIRALGAAAARERRDQQAAAVIAECFDAIEPLLGTKTACTAVGRPRATHYHRQAPLRPRSTAPRPVPPNKLSDAEVSQILDVLASPRFVDLSSSPAFHILLDEDTYLASVSTYYRLLGANGEVSERRRQATQPPRVRPRTVGTQAAGRGELGHHQAEGPKRGDYYDLYVVADNFSRYPVAWCVAPSESGELAKELIADAVACYQDPPGQLTVHADRLPLLGIGRTHSRPHVSNDNPYSENQFKTLK